MNLRHTPGDEMNDTCNRFVLVWTRRTVLRHMRSTQHEGRIRFVYTTAPHLTKANFILDRIKHDPDSEYARIHNRLVQCRLAGWEVVGWPPFDEQRT